MKFSQILKFGLALLCTYKVGELAGKMRAFNDFVDQHEDTLFAKDGYVTYEIRKGCVVYKHKKKESEEGDN